MRPFNLQDSIQIRQKSSGRDLHGHMLAVVRLRPCIGSGWSACAGALMAGGFQPVSVALMGDLFLI